MLRYAAGVATGCLVMAAVTTAAVSGRFLVLNPGDLFVGPPSTRMACFARPERMLSLPNAPARLSLVCLDHRRRFARQQIIEVRMQTGRLEVIHYDRRGRPRVIFFTRR